ncbi:T9SS type A sorting domain-containing protein [Reichenbachiella carrageenanivorans]|uniref:T9SS type A sorting domain-containing protein n=1 Tax=Reichenbachiella carrageenanivorans TaxID=2979869 RepID=A0ABY6D0U4_9BACT|nr:T9SS type A sorting domain-containing protein [Reichenbachiella carrageenanivorans]UXX79245.1 T9SS type A sorting domain-containing protein [Reichenbachiella carrageenanivorans]
MKALSLIVIATLTLSSVATAKIHGAGTKETEEIKANIVNRNDNMVFVQLENPVDSKVRIVITDEAGVTLYSETVKKDVKTVKRYDVSNLPAGVYSYKVYNGAYSIKKEIEKK